MTPIRAVQTSFLHHLQVVHYAKNEIDQDQVSPLIQKFKQLDTFPSALIPAFYVIDYTKQDYILMSEGARQIGHYDPRDFMDAGLSMLMEIYDKNDFKIYNEKVFAANRDFLATVPQETHDQYVFNYTFRIKNGHGGVSHLYQRGSYITSPVTKLPLYSLGMVMNITGIYDQRKIFHAIEKVKPGDALLGSEIIQQQYFFPYEEDTVLSRREKQIAALMAEGLSIKQISGKLRIAENTVANQRKNMLQKTGTKNMAELVAFVIRNGII